MPSRGGYYELRGVRPDGKGEASFYVSVYKIQELQRHGPSWKFDNARLLEEALQSPKSVFEGPQRIGMDAAYCYAAKPSRRYRQGGTIETPFSPNRVLVVYIGRMQGSDEFEILDWAIREEDGKNPGHPAGWEDDFGRRIWPETSPST